MINILKILNRTKHLFEDDLKANEYELIENISSSSFLVIGGAGSIGQAVVKEIFKRNPRKLHVVDLSENNLAELVRDIRSSYGYINGEFATFAIDAGSIEYDAFIKADGKYDYVLNLSALKHVRSEKDPYTLMRMINTNIFNTDKTLRQSIEKKVKKYFCVSTDKAANPVNMMGASKRIMEMFAMQRSIDIDVTMARFANVAFSDGSLLHSFNQRVQKNQPIVAPDDVKRYFITPQESGELCLMSCIFGENRDIFFPKLGEELRLTTFAEIAVRFLESLGLEPYLCNDEEEARNFFATYSNSDTKYLKRWPCLFTKSDTTGEKDFEEFYTENETLDMESFKNIGIIKNDLSFDEKKLDDFVVAINKLKDKHSWTKEDILKEFLKLIPDFKHKETGKYLDGKM